MWLALFCKSVPGTTSYKSVPGTKYGPDVAVLSASGLLFLVGYEFD